MTDRGIQELSRIHASLEKIAGMLDRRLPDEQPDEQSDAPELPPKPTPKRWTPDTEEPGDFYLVTDRCRPEDCPNTCATLEDPNHFMTMEAAENAAEAVWALLLTLDPATGLPYADGRVDQKES